MIRAASTVILVLKFVVEIGPLFGGSPGMLLRELVLYCDYFVLFKIYVEREGDCAYTQAISIRAKNVL